VEHEKHRVRRAALNAFFSKGSVRGLQGVIWERAQAVVGRLEGVMRDGSVVRVDTLMAAYSAGEFAGFVYLRLQYPCLADCSFFRAFGRTVTINTLL
jgi:hypothetical protein